MESLVPLEEIHAESGVFCAFQIMFKEHTMTYSCIVEQMANAANVLRTGFHIVKHRRPRSGDPRRNASVLVVQLKTTTLL